MSPSNSATATVWRPILLDPADPADQGRLSDLSSGGTIRESCDTLAVQLRDWAQVRTPGRRLAGPDADVRAAELLGGQIPPAFGRWAYYPWSDRLVRVLPPAEFIEVRTNRNRNKVTAEEQEKLERLTVGIVGLSVGNAVARTLALERTAGCLKLADFDTLDLSNLNRLQAGLHELGVNKAVLAARQIAELDPYVRIHVFAAGLSEANIEEFLDGGVPVSVLVDECDSLDIKLLLRERARKRRLPVLMETSDRGLLDVERFDQEPTRPLFHGRLADLDREHLTSLSAADKLLPTLEIVGLDTISPLMGASLVEIGRTLATWPQLGGEVALGGATVAAAIRRIGLGLPLPSGRVHVDLDRILECLAANPNWAAPHPTAAPGADALPSSIGSYAPTSSPTHSERIPGLHRFVVEHAVLAPSGGNCQPWRFYSEGEALHLVHDRERSANRLDVGHRASAIALGAALENAALAAAARGFATEITLMPQATAPAWIATLQFRADSSPATALFGEQLATVKQRVTNRRNEPSTPLTKVEIEALTNAVVEGACGRREPRTEHRAWLELVTDRTRLNALGEILGEADRIRFLCPDLHREMMAEVRWSPAESARTRDGLDVATLELGPADAAALRLLARPDVVAALRVHNTGAALAEAAIRAVEHASALGLICASGDGFADFLEAGRVVQRVWLAATRLGIAYQPMSPLAFMTRMLDDPSGTCFNMNERERIRELSGRFASERHRRKEGAPAFLFRLSRAGEVSARSVRRPLKDVLFVGRPE